LRKVVTGKDVSFLTTMTPGTYAFFFTPGPEPMKLDAIPETYRTGPLERQVEE
jgi:hypothetical protein